MGGRAPRPPSTATRPVEERGSVPLMTPEPAAPDGPPPAGRGADPRAGSG